MDSKLWGMDGWMDGWMGGCGDGQPKWHALCHNSSKHVSAWFAVKQNGWAPSKQGGFQAHSDNWCIALVNKLALQYTFVFKASWTCNFRTLERGEFLAAMQKPPGPWISMDSAGFLGFHGFHEYQFLSRTIVNAMNIHGHPWMPWIPVATMNIHGYWFNRCR